MLKGDHLSLSVISSASCSVLISAAFVDNAMLFSVVFPLLIITSQVKIHLIHTKVIFTLQLPVNFDMRTMTFVKWRLFNSC